MGEGCHHRTEREACFNLDWFHVQATPAKRTSALAQMQNAKTQKQRTIAEACGWGRQNQNPFFSHEFARGRETPNFQKFSVRKQKAIV